jgi:hypothetical protein
VPATATRKTALIATCLALAGGSAALSACGDDSSSPSPSPSPATASKMLTASSPEPPHTTPEPAKRNEQTLKLYDHGHPIVWVREGKQVEIRTGPGGGEALRTVGAHTEFGSRRVFSVVRSEGRWAGVTTPYAGNGELGWIELDPRTLKSGWLRDEIVIDLSAFQGELVRGDRVIRTFPITVGAPGSPTPTGRYAVTDTFRGHLNVAYGCCALALSAVQPALPSGWLGGNRIAIHGTYGPLGVAASHGCVRAANSDVSALLNKAPPGTPVLIHQ